MKKKIVRLGKLDRLYVTNRRPDQGVGPCALEASAVLNCWSNVRGGNPDAAECKAFVETLTNCMRNYVLALGSLNSGQSLTCDSGEFQHKSRLLIITCTVFLIQLLIVGDALEQYGRSLALGYAAPHIWKYLPDRNYSPDRKIVYYSNLQRGRLPFHFL